MQTSDESSQPSPSPAAANSPIPSPSTASQYTDEIPSAPTGILADSPTHSAHSLAVPSSPARPPAPPLESLFTTGDSDESERSGSSSEAEHAPEGQTDFSAFRRARAKKRLVFSDATKKSAPRAKAKREDPMSVHSETQRMIRESQVRIPDYQPPVISLQDVIKKLPKLTKPDTNTDTFVPLSTPPVSLPTRTTSTPLPKRALPASEETDELPDIDFASEQPIQRLELTTFCDQTDKCMPTVDQHKPTLNQPTLSLPNDFTQLNLVTNSLESFKTRFIQHSLPPSKPSPVPAVSESADSPDPLLPPAALSALARKPGAAHCFLRERLRQSLLARRAQEHQDMRARLRFENEEYFPSEGSCSEAEDIGIASANEVQGTGIDVNEEPQPETLVANNISDNNPDVTSSSDSESESDSETSESGESEGDSSDSDEEMEECIKIPSMKAKRQRVDEDSDTGDEESRLNADNIGDRSAVNFEDEVPQPLQTDSTSQPFSQELIHGPNLSQSIHIETSNHEIIAEDGHGKEFEDSSLINSSLNYLPYSEKFNDYNARDTFKIPSGFQLSHSHSQCGIPEGLSGICDPTQEEEEGLLPLICSGGFTQATQATQADLARDDVAPVTAVESSQLDETVDADIPVLAPRKLRVRDQLRLKRYRRLAEFEEREAELSGSDPELEGSESGGELDEYESEEGDFDPVESEEIERLNAKYYNRVMLEDDAANMALLKEKFLPEQAIVEDGLRMKNGLFRKRKFNFDTDEMSSSATCEWDEGAREHDPDQLITQERRRRRVEREEYMARKSACSISDLAYGDTRTLPLVDKPNIIRTMSCDNKTTGPMIPSIRKSLGTHNSLLSRNFSNKSSKLDPNFLSDSSNDSKFVVRKAFVFQTTRSLEGTESSSVPALSKSVSVPNPNASSSAIKKVHHFKTKIQPELTKEITIFKPDSSVFRLLNVN